MSTIPVFVDAPLRSTDKSQSVAGVSNDMLDRLDGVPLAMANESQSESPHYNSPHGLHLMSNRRFSECEDNSPYLYLSVYQHSEPPITPYSDINENLTGYTDPVLDMYPTSLRSSFSIPRSTKHYDAYTDLLANKGQSDSPSSPGSSQSSSTNQESMYPFSNGSEQGWSQELQHYINWDYKTFSLTGNVVEMARDFGRKSIVSVQNIWQTVKREDMSLLPR